MIRILFTLFLALPAISLFGDDCGVQLEVRSYFNMSSTTRGALPKIIRDYKNNTQNLPTKNVREQDIFITDFNDVKKLGEADAIALSLKSGDGIVLRDGGVLVLGKFLGAGNLTHVFQCASFPGWVIRIPRAIENRGGPKISMMSYHFYRTSYERALTAGLPLIPLEFKGDMILAREVVPFENLNMFRTRMNALQRSKVKFQASDVARINKLKEFIYALRGMPGIEDVDLSQIVFFENRWVINDWTGFQPMARPDYWHSQYNTVITQIRDTMRWNPGLTDAASNAHKNVLLEFPY